MSNSNQPEEISVTNHVSASLKTPVIRDILKSQFNTKTKISNEAIQLMTELAREITVEAALRAAKQATIQNSKMVTLEHTESILPQMMLDFP